MTKRASMQSQLLVYIADSLRCTWVNELRS